MVAETGGGGALAGLEGLLAEALTAFVLVEAAPDPVRLAHPKGYAPDPRIVAIAEGRAKERGGHLVFGHDPEVLVRGVDIVYTDAWTSMGQEAETEARRDAFAAYRVDDALMDAAGPGAMAMHCLPAHRGEEITSSVMDGPRSLIFEQSENRLHVQKALLVELIGARA